MNEFEELSLQPEYLMQSTMCVILPVSEQC